MIHIETAKNHFAASCEKIQKEINERQQILNKMKEIYAAKNAKLEQHMPEIEAALKKIGFEITKLEIHTYNWERWIKEDPEYVFDLHCYCRVKMIGKRKPFGERNYYDKQQCKRMDESASKAAQQFKELTGFRCEVNQFSLDKADNVLFNFSI